MTAKPKPNACGVKTPVPGRAVQPGRKDAADSPANKMHGAAQVRTSPYWRKKLGWDPKCWWL